MFQNKQRVCHKSFVGLLSDNRGIYSIWTKRSRSERRRKGLSLLVARTERDENVTSITREHLVWTGRHFRGL